MSQLTVKNKRLKMSPGGLITLPVSARRGLGMEQGKGAHVNIQVKQNVIVLTPTAQGARVSPGGALEVNADAKRVLSAAAKRHYWLEVDDKSHSVTLHPFQA